MINTIKKVANFVYDRLGPGHEEAIYRDAMSVEFWYVYLYDTGWWFQAAEEEDFIEIVVLL